MGSSGIVLSSGPHRLLRGRWEGQRHRDSKRQAAESGEWGSQRTQNLPIPLCGKRMTCSLGGASAQMLNPVTTPFSAHPGPPSLSPSYFQCPPHLP